MEVIAAVTGLVAVVSSFFVAVISMRQADHARRSAEDHEIVLSLQPRRLDALEAAWYVVYEAEAGGPIPDADLRRLIELSIWLPKKIRDGVLRVAAAPATAPDDFSQIRQLLVTASGTAGAHRLLEERLA